MIARRTEYAIQQGDLPNFEVRQMTIKPGSPKTVGYKGGGGIVFPSMDFVVAMIKYKDVVPADSSIPVCIPPREPRSN